MTNKIEQVIQHVGNELIALDKEQQQYEKNQLYFKIGMAGLIVSFMGLIILLTAMGINRGIAGMVAGTYLLAALKGIQSWYNNYSGSVRLFYKTKLIAPVMQLFHPNYTYQYQLDSFAKYPALSTNPPKEGDFKWQDSITGQYEGVDFNMIALHDKKSNFKGILYTIPLDLKTPFSLCFTPRMLPTEMIRLHITPPSKVEPLVFEHLGNLTVLTDNVDMAAMFMTENLAIQLHHIRTKFGKKSLPDFSIIDNKFYVLIPNYTEYLEISAMSSVEHKKTTTRLVNQIDNLVFPIHQLIPVLASYTQKAS
jgi:uncharacterized protein YbaR (Trm112 family)